MKEPVETWGMRFQLNLDPEDSKSLNELAKRAKLSRTDVLRVLIRYAAKSEGFELRVAG
jgi:hypothetical protein